MKFRDYTGKRWGKGKKMKTAKHAAVLPAGMYLTLAQSITAVWDFKPRSPALSLIWNYKNFCIRMNPGKIGCCREQCDLPSQVRLPLKCSSLEDNLSGLRLGQAAETILL